MGRFYSGDIEGKFWFAVQSSDDAEHFGAYQRDVIEYTVPNDEAVQKGIDKCRRELSGYKKLLDKFFDIIDGGYNNKMIIEYLESNGMEANEDIVRHLLENYARLELGLKIKNYFDENPDAEELYFEAEL